MNFPRLSTSTLLSLACTLASAAFAAVPTKDDPVQLDKFDVTAEKENTFSLPLDAIASSGSRLGLSSRDLPASVSIITQEMMQLRGLRTAVEAVEAAVGMTGGTQFGSIPSYSTRGFGGNNVSILRDGIRQNTASQSSRTVDSFILDRIEVLKGPDGLMYGEGAIGGAVNYISKSPGATFRGDALASLGPWGSYRVGAGIGGPVGGTRLSYRADYSHNETNGYQDRNYQRYDAVALSIGWRASDRFSLTWWGTFLDDRNESYYGNPVIYDAVVNTTVANAQPEVRTFNSATDRMINPRVDPAARRTNYNILDNTPRPRTCSTACAPSSGSRRRSNCATSPTGRRSCSSGATWWRWGRSPTGRRCSSSIAAKGVGGAMSWISRLRPTQTRRGSPRRGCGCGCASHGRRSSGWTSTSSSM